MITNERLATITRKLISHLSERLKNENDKGDELYSILSNRIGMTDNEIDQLSGNFDSDREGFDDEDEDLNLPSEAIIEIDELDCCQNDEDEILDAVVEFLTDEFGFCIKNCRISLEDEGLAKVTNIEWDTED